MKTGKNEELRGWSGSWQQGQFCHLQDTPEEAAWLQPSVISLASLATAVGLGNEFWSNWKRPLHVSLVVYCRSSHPWNMGQKTNSLK